MSETGKGRKKQPAACKWLSGVKDHNKGRKGVAGRVILHQFNIEKSIGKSEKKGTAGEETKKQSCRLL